MIKSKTAPGHLPFGRSFGVCSEVALKLSGKVLRRPTDKHCLPAVTPSGAEGNFGTNISRFLAFGIFEHERNVTIVFDFYANEAASEVIPFLFSCDSCIRLGRQRHIRPWPFPLVNLRWCN